MRDSLLTAMDCRVCTRCTCPRGLRRPSLFPSRFPSRGLTCAQSDRLGGRCLNLGRRRRRRCFCSPWNRAILLGAVLSRDMPMVTGIALFSALIYMVVMLVVKALEAFINPAALEVVTSDSHRKDQCRPVCGYHRRRGTFPWLLAPGSSSAVHPADALRLRHCNTRLAPMNPGATSTLEWCTVPLTL